MNPYREKMLKDQEDSDKALFEKIKNIARPDILDLWSLSPERFYEWRKLNDFPKLLDHFDKTLILFKEWKQENPEKDVEMDNSNKATEQKASSETTPRGLIK